MSETKYDRHVLSNPFHEGSEEFGGGTIFKHVDDENSGIIYEVYYINDLNWAVEKPLVADTHEMLVFLGGDPRDIREFGAEVRICVGDNKEEHLINDATVLSIPAGLKHGPIAVNKISKPFVLLRVVNTKEYQEKLDADGDEEKIFMQSILREGSEHPKYGKYYWMNFVKGPFFADYEPGWFGTSIWAHHNEYKSGMTLGYHCIVSDYDVEFAHNHGFHELLCFLSGDPENPYDLGADVTVCLGDEHEEQNFSVPTIVSMPPGLIHSPVHVKNVTKPVVFLEISSTRNFDDPYEG